MGTHTHKAPYLAHTQGTLLAQYTRHPIGQITQGTLLGTIHKALYRAHYTRHSIGHTHKALTIHKALYAPRLGLLLQIEAPHKHTAKRAALNN